jgi:hypothetical protein
MLSGALLLASMVAVREVGTNMSLLILSFCPPKRNSLPLLQALRRSREQWRDHTRNAETNRLSTAVTVTDAH